MKGPPALAFEHFDSDIVMGTCTPENERSAKILVRSGFKQVAHYEKDYFNGHEMEDTVVYHIARNAWTHDAL